jgi:predicted HTH domain antitoxin
MTYQLTINYPETFPDALQQTKAQFEQEAKWAMAVKLFELKRLSSGMAAALIGVDRVTFLLKLKDSGLTQAHYIYCAVSQRTLPIVQVFAPAI